MQCNWIPDKEGLLMNKDTLKRASGAFLVLVAIAFFIPSPLSSKLESYYFYPLGIVQVLAFSCGRFLNAKEYPRLLIACEVLVFLIFVLLYYEALNLVWNARVQGPSET